MQRSNLYKYILPVLFLFILTKGNVQDKPLLLIISVQGDIFTAARHGITSELEDYYSFKTIIISSTTTPEEVRKAIWTTIPQAIALLDNKAINLYRKYCETLEDSSAIIPAVALVSINAQMAIAGLKNIQAISYEAPLVTALVQLRNVLNIPLTKAGVIYRKEFEPFVTEQSYYCKKENIAIEKNILNVRKDSYSKNIQDYLEALISKKKVQAILVLNDNVILKPDLLMKSWIPYASKCNVPFIVGVETLVKPEFNFGTFAVLPDARAAGEQAAEIFVQLMEQNWHFDSCIVHPAISVYTVLNYEKVKTFKHLNINRVDKIIKLEAKQ